MRIVIDTNVLISGIIFGGKPSKIIELLFGKKISVFASPEMVDEYKRIYGELGERYAKRTHNELNEIINSMNILPSHSHIEACRDPDDNKFIECGEPVIRINPENDINGGYVHRSIRIENNRFHIKGDCAVSARSVDGLKVSGNTFILPEHKENIIRTTDCANVEISNNNIQIKE